MEGTAGFKDEQISQDSVLVTSLSGGDGGRGADVDGKVLGRAKASRPKSAACSGLSEDVACGLRLERWQRTTVWGPSALLIQLKGPGPEVETVRASLGAHRKLCLLL